MKIKNLLCIFGGFCSLILISGCASSQLIPPPQDNYGLSVESAATGEPMIIDSSTPVLEFNNRLYYFQNQSELDMFRKNPDYYITRYPFNEVPKIIPPLISDYGLKTNCAYNADPIVVTQFTPTLSYMGRIYYFAHTESRSSFIEDPQMFVAKFPANKVPKTISPLRSAYGTKTQCATTGIPILVGPHTPALEYMGQVFYFSDLPSMEAFKKDPQAYIDKQFNVDTQSPAAANSK